MTVNIGDNVVIRFSSVVSKVIPHNDVAVGSLAMLHMLMINLSVDKKS